MLVNDHAMTIYTGNISTTWIQITELSLKNKWSPTEYRGHLKLLQIQSLSEPLTVYEDLVSLMSFIENG